MTPLGTPIGQPSRYTDHFRLGPLILRTDGQRRTNEDLWLSTRDRLTIRDARARIRNPHLADFGGKR